MNNPINDGGPAFPTDFDMSTFKNANQGMSLRDWFAGMAIQGMLAGRKCALTNVALGDMISSAFVIADAALKAREIPQ